jgi:hypothetical protein
MHFRVRGDLRFFTGRGRGNRKECPVRSLCQASHLGVGLVSVTPHSLVPEDSKDGGCPLTHENHILILIIPAYCVERTAELLFYFLHSTVRTSCNPFDSR